MTRQHPAHLPLPNRGHTVCRVCRRPIRRGQAGWVHAKLERVGRPAHKPRRASVAAQAVDEFRQFEAIRQECVTHQEACMVRMFKAGMLAGQIAAAIDWPESSVRNALRNMGLVSAPVPVKPATVLERQARSGSILFG